MNLFEVIEFLLRFVFIDLVENSVLIMFALLFMNKVFEVKKITIVLLATTLFVQFVYPVDETIMQYIANRMIVFAFIDMMVLIVYKLKLNKFLYIFKYILLSMCVTIVLEGLSVLPFVYFLDLDMDVVSSNIYTLLILSFPTRMIEYLALNLYYNRRKNKHEKSNCSNKMDS